MTRRRRNKPSSPAEIAARRAQLQETRNEVARLKDQGAEVSQDNRTGEITGAYKPDVVVMMRRSEVITPSDESAVRSFERLVQKAAGSSASCLSVLDRVSGGDTGDQGIGAHIEAAQQLRRRQRRMDPLTWALLRDLCDGNLLVTRWRVVVQKRTGETNEKAQGGIIRQAFRVLAAVEDDIRRSPANDDHPQPVAIPLVG
ncbi:MAG: hypothetical protein EON90_02135 [Brevundimonas sp.]|nr:MAG: hypothetical protein EON90_02135 [Brevundimonas sp.]